MDAAKAGEMKDSVKDRNAFYAVYLYIRNKIAHSYFSSVVYYVKSIHNILLLHPLAISGRPFFSKFFVSNCCCKRFCQEGFYCFQHGTVIIRFRIDFTDKSFPFLLHCHIVIKAHNLFKLFCRENMFTVHNGNNYLQTLF